MTGFKKDFLWGAATSAYQIEGGQGIDGRSDSVWDTFVESLVLFEIIAQVT